MIFETHHDIYLPADQCWHMIYTLSFYTKKKKSEKKFIVKTTYLRRARWYFRGVLNDSFFYIYIWNLTRINIWRIEETTKYRKWNWGICYYCYYHLFIDALWDPALCCDDFVCEFEFLLYWLFHTYNSQFVLMCFCVHIHILPLCCMPHLLIFLRCSLAFVIRPVSIVLAFMPCSQNLAFPFIIPHRQKTPWSSACQ